MKTMLFSFIAVFGFSALTQADTVMECQGNLDVEYQFQLIKKDSRYVGELIRSQVGSETEKIPLEVCSAGDLHATPGNIVSCNNMNLTDRWNLYFSESLIPEEQSWLTAEVVHNEQSVGNIQCEQASKDPITVVGEKAQAILNALTPLKQMPIATGYYVSAKDLTCEYTPSGFVWANCQMIDTQDDERQKYLKVGAAHTLFTALEKAGVPVKRYEEPNFVSSSVQVATIQCSIGGIVGRPLCTIHPH